MDRSGCCGVEHRHQLLLLVCEVPLEFRGESIDLLPQPLRLRGPGEHSMQLRDERANSEPATPI
jgi:hypothetical protein